MTDTAPRADQPHSPAVTAEHLIDAVTDIALLVIDTTGRITSWNTGAERIHGWNAAEVLGRHVSVLLPLDVQAGGRADQELETAGQIGRYEAQTLRVRRDG